MMRATFFTYTRQGVATARRIQAALTPDWACSLYAPAKYAGGGVEALEGSLADTTGRQWAASDALIYVAASGIAVRAIAPHVQDKAIDPAVLCVDVSGRFVISLLSGHIGGGNRLARRIAGATGATPVITTATDVNQRFAVDEWAQQHGFVLSSMQLAKEVSAAILEGNIPFSADAPVSGEIPQGLFSAPSGPIGISFSAALRAPYARTLRLIPSALCLGIGCRKGVTGAQVEEAVCRALLDNGWEPRAVLCAATIDLKREEKGLLAFCGERGIPLRFYSAQQLAALPGTFTVSEFVLRTTGVDNICERAACMDGGALVVRKTALNGVTVAVAQASWEVRF